MIDRDNYVMHFSRAAVRLGEMAPDSIGPRSNRVDSAQWLLPLWEGRAPESAQGLNDPSFYEPTIRAMAAFVVGNPAASEIVVEWNGHVSPHEDPLRFVTRWL